MGLVGVATAWSAETGFGSGAEGFATLLKSRAMT